MIKRIVIVAAGLAAFVVASAVVSIVQMTVTSLIPGSNKNDPPGVLDPDPIERIRAEHGAKQPKAAASEPKSEAKEEPQSEPQSEPAPEPAQQAAREPEPAPVARAEPPVRSSPPAPTGPGNYADASYREYNAPSAPYGATGPGNL